MHDPLDPLRGHIIKTRHGAYYQIQGLERIPRSFEFGYLLQICPADANTTSAGALSQCEEFCTYFSPLFRVPEHFGTGEEGHLNYLLSLLEFSLDQHPRDHLEQNEQGQYLMTFE